MELLLKIGLGILLAALAIEDIRCKRISSVKLVAGFLLAIGLCLAERHSAGEIVTGVFLGIAFLTISWITQEKLGMGDSLMIGILCVGLGGIRGMIAIICALFIAGLFSAVMLMGRKYTLKSNLPFIPFLFAGYIGVVLL